MNRSKSEAWNDGYNTYLKGLGIHHCPYSEDDEYYHEWIAGWKCAYKQENDE